MLKKLMFFVVAIAAVSTILVIWSTPSSTLFHSRQILQININKFDTSDMETSGIYQYKIKSDVALEPAKLSNVPDVYYNNSEPRIEYNETCAHYPSLFNLTFNHDQWQVLETSNGTFQLFNAFLDDRILAGSPKIRILGMANRVDPVVPVYCQIWTDKGNVTVTKVHQANYIWLKAWGAGRNGTYHPYLFACNWTGGGHPTSVSLVERPCTPATNNLKVIYNKAVAKRKFGVCVKGLSYPQEDLTSRLVEWIELVRILGAEEIMFYEFAVLPNVKKLLDYYQRQGLVTVEQLRLVGFSDSPILQNLFLKKNTLARRLQEVIPYNDCLYKMMYKYEYVVVLDIDEVIVPTMDTWHELIQSLEKQDQDGKATGFSARNVYFFDAFAHQHGWFKDIPRFMHMLQHVYRTSNYTPPGTYIKCFQKTDRVLTLHNHYPMQCLGSKCKTVSIDTTLAHLQHYRRDCVADMKNCAELKRDFVMDTRLWNYKRPLIQRIHKTLIELDLLKLI